MFTFNVKCTDLPENISPFSCRRFIMWAFFFNLYSLLIQLNKYTDRSGDNLDENDQAVDGLGEKMNQLSTVKLSHWAFTHRKENTHNYRYVSLCFCRAVTKEMCLITLVGVQQSLLHPLRFTLEMVRDQTSLELQLHFFQTIGWK